MGAAPDMPAAVAAAFAAFPEEARSGLISLRALIFETAADIPEVGPLEETLKWGQPAYLTPRTKSGTTIRLGVPKTGGFALYTHCQSTVMSDFDAQFPGVFDVEGNRAVHFHDASALPTAPLRLLIGAALTYHLRAKK